jgi:hypothetical protein
MERKGRTNAEKQLRLTRMQLAAAHAGAAAAAAAANGAGGGAKGAPGGAAGGGAAAAAEEQEPPEEKLGAAASSVAGIKGAAPPITMFPVRPIGYLHTCFSTRWASCAARLEERGDRPCRAQRALGLIEPPAGPAVRSSWPRARPTPALPLRAPPPGRNGTPRQPLLVPSARSVLRLAPNIPADCLDGLQQYSHCWVLYLFHANTSERPGTPGGLPEACSGLRVPQA